MPSDLSTAKFRILLSSMSRLMCDAIETMIADDECSLVGKATTVTDTLALKRMFNPDVVIVEADLPGDVNMQFVEQLSTHIFDTPIVILTLCTKPTIIHQLLQLNIQACLTRDIDRGELIKTLKLLKSAQGQKIFSAILVSQPTYQSFTSAVMNEMLTKREQQVLALVLQGKTNKEIADNLHVSQQSIRNYLYTIYRKFSVKTRSDLILLFHQNYK